MARNARPCGRKNPLPFPFSEQSPLSDFRQIRNKGNGIHKGGNLGVHPCAHLRRCGEPPSRPDCTHSEIFSKYIKISKADRHTHRLRKNISRSADRFSDSADSDSAADSADPAGSGSCSACSFGSPRFVCNAILHRKREKYTRRTCRIAKNLLKLFCVLYS